MIRRSLLLALAAALALTGCGGSDARDAPRPDVVLIVVDTLRADRLGCYGYPRPTSPVIDALAAEGTLFEDATAQASWTLLSMSSMWTGRYLTANSEAPDPDWPVLAEVFRDAGYRTIGRSANPLLSDTSGFARGFDDYAALGERGKDKGGYPSADRLVSETWEPLDRVLAEGERGTRPPVFLYLQPFDPHTPYRRHPELDAELAPGGTLPLRPPRWHAEELAKHGPPSPADDPGWARALKAMHRMRGVYDQEVRFVDRELGVLLEGLRARGVLDHAVVALVSDHGEGLWDHPTPIAPEKRKDFPPDLFFFGGHGYTLFQESIHTPFLLWGAGVPKGVRVDEPVENIDLYPTLLSLAGLKAPARLDGHSLLRLAEGRETEWRTLVFSFVRQYASVQDRTSGLKLVEPTAFGRKKALVTSLYHLPSDPSELKDLADERPEDVARLRKVLEDWIERHPTTITFRQHTPEELETMAGLGYTGDHSSALKDDEEGDEGAEPRDGTGGEK